MGIKLKFTCETCGEDFLAELDHGNRRRFCSRKCFCSQPLRTRKGELKPRVRPGMQHYECENCGKKFRAYRIRKYCSFKCGAEGQLKGEEVPCDHCGKLFYRQLSKTDKVVCCSAECRNAHYMGPANWSWKGGKYIQQESGDEMKITEELYDNGHRKYKGAHRLVAEQHIGRKLFSHEYVIRVDVEKRNADPNNLFICASSSEYAKRRSGSLPWPNRSNLKTYEK